MLCRKAQRFFMWVKSSFNNKMNHAQVKTVFDSIYANIRAQTQQISCPVEDKEELSRETEELIKKVDLWSLEEKLEQISLFEVMEQDGLLNNGLNNGLYKKIISELNLKESDSLLEIGVGGEGISFPYVNKTDYYGVDVSKLSVYKARSLAGSFGLRPERIIGVETGKKLPFDDQNFDKVFSVCTFHEIEDAEQELSEVDRVLRKEGRCSIVERYTKTFEAKEEWERLQKEVTVVTKFLQGSGYFTSLEWFKADYTGRQISTDGKYDFFHILGEKKKEFGC